MSTNEFLAYDRNSMVVRPLTELPTLRVADPAHDVRGWEVRGHDGHRLGTVADLLVNIDQLSADTLLVSLVGGERADTMVVVPLDGLSPDHGGHRRLVPGDGMRHASDRSSLPIDDTLRDMGSACPGHHCTRWVGSGILRLRRGTDALPNTVED